MTDHIDPMLDAINPGTQTLTLSDRKDVVVSPLRVRQLGPFTRAVRPVANDLLLAIESGDFLTTIELHSDRVIEAVAVATGEAEEYIGELYPDDLVRLIRAVVEVNTDFFIRKLAPELTKTLAGMQGSLAEKIKEATQTGRA